MADYIDQVLGPDGILAKTLQGYESRPGQVLLAKAIDQAFCQGIHCLAEGPCGVGKSIAYGVPAIAHAVCNAKTCVIATANIALQEQLFYIDLPFLQRVLPFKFGFALLKGRNNYLCEDKLRVGAEADGSLKRLRSRPETRKQVEQVMQWSRTTETGDKTELKPAVSQDVWRAFSSLTDDCQGVDCGYADTCWYNKAKALARDKQIIVTNYHMLFAHLADKRRSGEDRVLPPFSHLVMDECFVAGTLVAGRPIERVMVGDMVPSYDTRTNRIVYKSVLHVFRRRPKALMRLRIGGNDLICTPNHPILTTCGWRPARRLLVGDLVRVWTHDKENSRHVLSHMRKIRNRIRKEDDWIPTQGPRLLLPGTRRNRQIAIAFPSHASEESNAQRGREKKGKHEPACGRTQAACTRWQGQDNTGAAAKTGTRVRQGLVHRIAHRIETAQEARLAHALSCGYSESEINVGRRSGWAVAQGSKGERSRRKKRATTARARVDRVEVLEPGSDGQYNGLCQDGFVYNLEVADTHTYVANNVIVHNCHEAAKIAREFMGFSVSPFSMKRLEKWCKRVKKPKLGMQLTEATGKFFEVAKAVLASRAYNIRLRQANWDNGAHIQLCTVLAELSALADVITDSDADFDTRREAADARRDAHKLRARLLNATALEDPNYVYWLEPAGRTATAVKGKPIDVSERLNQDLFQTVRSAIMASATLTTGNNFSYVRRELGVPDNASEIVVPSPFDYGKQALMVVPERLPDVKDPVAFPQAVADAALATIAACDGRTLCLFTSKKNMKEVFKLVLHGGVKHRVMMQDDEGELSRTELSRLFKENLGSVLFGVASFWTGLDVPGEALTGLLIDKLPFANQSDPLFNAINETKRNAFAHYTLPQAIITMRQGVGRLIRRQTDYGVIVVTDKRIVENLSYGKAFLDSLPPMMGTRSLEDMRGFIEEHRQKAVDRPAAVQLPDDQPMHDEHAEWVTYLNTWATETCVADRRTVTRDMTHAIVRGIDLDAVLQRLNVNADKLAELSKMLAEAKCDAAVAEAEEVQREMNDGNA